MNKYVVVLLMMAFIAMPITNQTSAETGTNPINSNSISESQKDEEVEAIYSLTLEEAIEWALVNSYQKRMAQLDIERSELTRENAAERVFYIPIGTGNGEEDAIDRSALKSLVSADISLQMSKKELEVTEQQIRYTVMQVYQDIFQLENQVKSNQEAYELAKMEEQAMIALDKIGRISKVEKNDIVKARIDVEQNLLTAQTDLQEALANLNTLMGKSEDNVYHLVDRPTYLEPQELNLDVHITRKVSSSPTIWLLEKQVELAELDITLYTYNAGQSYDLVQLDVARAKTLLTNSKEQLRESIKNIYSNVQKLEEQYQTLQRNLRSAEESLRLAQVKLERGLVTALEVKKEEFNVNQIQRSMEELVMRMDQLRFILHNPWV